MDAIYKLFSSPEWWFSTIFMGVLFVIVGAYARDGIDAALSAISTRYKARSVRLAKEKEQRIANMLMEPTLLVVAHIRITQQFLALLGLMALSYVIPAYSVLVAHFPDAEPLAAVLPRTKIPYGNIIATGLAFAGAMVAQWRLTASITECRVARRRVEEVTADRVAAHAAQLAAARERAASVATSSAAPTAAAGR